MSWLSDTISSWIPNELKNNDALKAVALAATAYYGYSALQGTSLGTELATMGSKAKSKACLLYTSPSPRDRQKSRMPSSA